MFCPSEQDLVSFYLHWKNQNHTYNYPMIPEINIYNHHPVDLVGNGAGHFFNRLPTKDSIWSKSNRSTALKDDNGVIMGYRQNSRLKNGNKEWILAEYRQRQTPVSDFVITKVYPEGKNVSEAAPGTLYYRAVKDALPQNLNFAQQDIGLVQACKSARTAIDIGLDPGWLFAPSDQVLVSTYLSSMLEKSWYSYPMIPIMNIYNEEPSELVGDGSGYFFTPRTRLYSTSSSANRVALNGHWTKSSNTLPIEDENGVQIGSKHCLKFVPSIAENEAGTWLMNEYLSSDEEFASCAISKIYSKANGKSIQAGRSYFLEVRVAMHLRTVLDLDEASKAKGNDSNDVQDGTQALLGLKVATKTSDVDQDESKIESILEESKVDDYSLCWVFEDGV